MRKTINKARRLTTKKEWKKQNSDKNDLKKSDNIYFEPSRYCSIY